MRKWKIRTKMVFGLGTLAFAIAALVYSSWSLMTRDRFVAEEIDQLADEIQCAHELDQFADGLVESHRRFIQLSQTKSGMIEADTLPDLAEKRRQQILIDTVLEIEDDFDNLDQKIKVYQGQVQSRIGAPEESILLVEGREQLGKLEAIASTLQQAREDWSSAKSPIHSPLPSAMMLYAPAKFRETLDLLVDQTDTHSMAIQKKMKDFRRTVLSQQRAKRRSFWFFTATSAFFIVFLAWQFMTFVVVPFRTLFRGSQLIANGHHHHQIELGTDDEIGLMAETVNDITARFNRAVESETIAKQAAQREVRERTREVIQNEQLASVGFLAAGLAHEINNPLGAIAWSAEALEESLTDLPNEQRSRIDPDLLNELTTNLGLIQSEAFRCKGITGRLLDFSRLSHTERSRENVGSLVQKVVSMVAKVGEYRCKTIETSIDQDVFAHCNAQEIQQVVLNLVCNALESVDQDGKVTVTVRDESDSLTGISQAVVVVQDDGCGMDQEVLDNLFEPFFTRRRDETGTGLGLSISYRIVSLHHGSLTPHSDGEGCGSRMTLRLPAKAPSESTKSELPPRLQNYNSPSSTKWNDVEKVA